MRVVLDFLNILINCFLERGSSESSTKDENFCWSFGLNETLMMSIMNEKKLHRVIFNRMLLLKELHLVETHVYRVLL